MRQSNWRLLFLALLHLALRFDAHASEPILSAAPVVAPLANASSNIRVGVYYFPGWRDHAEPSRALPWETLKAYPERKPLQGWYQEGDDAVTRQQLSWMRQHQVAYVIYDWYWTKSGKPRLAHAIDSFLRVGSAAGPRFSIMWANHNEVPLSLEQFDQISDVWIEHYFADPRYETVDGRPLLVIFSPESLDKRARLFGSNATELIQRLRQRCRERLGTDPYVVGATHAVAKRVNDQFLRHGYDAYSGYNYHYGVEGVFRGANYSHSYAELSAGYAVTWRWMLENSALPYILPVTSGWDRRPWGGSHDPLHDLSGGTPAQFFEQVRAARDLIQRYPVKSLGRLHVCCWNEYGEGSYIEPTEAAGFGFLEALQRGISGK